MIKTYSHDVLRNCNHYRDSYTVNHPFSRAEIILSHTPIYCATFYCLMPVRSQEHSCMLQYKIGMRVWDESSVYIYIYYSSRGRPPWHAKHSIQRPRWRGMITLAKVLKPKGIYDSFTYVSSYGNCMLYDTFHDQWKAAQIYPRRKLVQNTASCRAPKVIFCCEQDFFQLTSIAKDIYRSIADDRVRPPIAWSHTHTHKLHFSIGFFNHVHL